MSFLKRTIPIFIVLLSTAVLVSIIWAAWQIIQQPDLGALWSENGYVYYAKEDLSLQVGDNIVSIDNVPFQESSFPYYLWQKGDVIQLKFTRNGQTTSFDTVYENQAPPFIIITRLSIVVVAVIFWAVGSILALLMSHQNKPARLFFLLCQFMGTSLALGNVTSYSWSASLTILILWWVPPLAVHFHLLFPLNETSPILKWIWVGYIIPTLALIYKLVELIPSKRYEFLDLLYGISFYLWIFIGLCTVLFLLVRAYRNASSPEIQRQIGLIVMSGFLSLTPLLLFSVIPKIILGDAIIDTPFSFIFLIGIPLGYGYAIKRYHLIKLEQYINRSTTIVLLIGILGLLYLGISTVLQNLAPISPHFTPLINLITINILLAIHNPLRRRLQNYVDHFFFGGWYDYSLVVGEVTQTLEETTDIKALTQLLSDSIQTTMRVKWACLLFPDPETQNSAITMSGQIVDPFFSRLQAQDISNIVEYLQRNSKPTTTRELHSALAKNKLSESELTLLDIGVVQLWVPIHGRGTSTGILILGSKYGGDIFNVEDMEILHVISRQASTAFQNVQLITELEQNAKETEKYQKEILRVREQERAHIARELHDVVIQALVGLNYKISNITSITPTQTLTVSENQTEAVRKEINHLIQTTRILCQDLRPPALDLGLVPSLRSVVSRFEMKTGIEVTLIVEGNRDIHINEDIALCLFRCTSESLQNIKKHASADHVTVELHINQTFIQLIVKDNGCGFSVPDRLGVLMENNHFGIVGMRERIELMNGVFYIKSLPQNNTRIEINIPLDGIPIKMLETNLTI
jgi:signal transduction histidine kinase